MISFSINLKPEVSGVCVITRHGKVVGKTPIAPLPMAAKAQAAKDADGEAEKSESSSASATGEDPF